MSDALLPEQQRALDYLARKGTNAPVGVLRTQVTSAFAEIEAAFDAVPFDVRDREPAAGKWSPREILDHLVLSHGPAVPQLASLVAGVDPSDGAIPADLHRDAPERPAWEDLRKQLGEVHRALLALIRDDAPLTARVAIELVVKIDGQPLRWIERFDWKAFVQGIRVHTLEHHRQLQRTLASMAPEPFPRLEASQVGELQALFERCSEFFLLTEGAAPHATHAAEELALRAPGKTADDTFCFGVFRDERLVGFIHLTREFPKPDEWFLGLLVLDPAVRGQGVGVAVHDTLRDWIASQGANVLWLGVLTQNEPAERFWRARGYIERERRPFTPPSGFTSTMILMSLPLR